MPVRPHCCLPSIELKTACRTLGLLPLIMMLLMGEACSKPSPTQALTAGSTTSTASAAPTAAPAPAAAARPRTRQDEKQEHLAWLRRHSVPAAQKVSGQDLPLDPNLAQFLERVCLAQSRQEGAPEAAALEMEGRTLYEGGYDNPVFLRAYGQVLAACGKTTESNDVETQALMKFPEPVASPINVFMASAQLATAMRAEHGPFYPAALSVQRAALRRLASAIAEGAFTLAESPIAWRLLTENVGPAALASPWKDVQEGLQTAKIDPWLAQMIRGMAELEAARAWIATGGSAAASKVQVDQTTFQHVTAARKSLAEAQRLNPERTEAKALAAEVEKLAGGQNQLPVASSQLPVEKQVASSGLQVASSTQELPVAGSQLPVASSELQVARNIQTTNTLAMGATTETQADVVPAVPLMALRGAAPATTDSQSTTQSAPLASVIQEAPTTATEPQNAPFASAPGNPELLSALNLGDPTTANDLIRGGAAIAVADSEGYSPLHLATAKRLTETMRLLLGRGAPVDARTPLGETPLHLACKSGAIESVRLLLDNGANPNTPAPEGWTPLDLAVQRQYGNIVGLLLERGAKVNAAGSGGTAPLMIAVQAGATDIVRKLLELGADPNATPYPPATPLHEAIRLGHAGIAINLIDLGAKVNVPDRRNRMPLHAAVERRLPTVAAKLIQTGALPEARNAEGATALELAIEQGDPEMVKTLLENRAGVKTPTSTGGTCLDLARQKGNVAVIELIQARTN